MVPAYLVTAIESVGSIPTTLTRKHFSTFSFKESSMGQRPQDLELGCIAKDSITGFQGVVIAITEWLNGCQRVTIQPQEMKDGKPIDNFTFDAEQVVVVSPAKPVAVTKTGGPSISPVQRSDPK